ncbi:hypothetical protein CXF72_18870 [Psychromonas sp. MB-3u-54]|jgi:ribosome biogenesis GTPase A|uniref:hypothetical protein n=1 Tax=Psychromonas sp. MB-3u-54 TaxID=2058319 RepID=UPI000C321597|nr:hypothetical protein [Psychromonas sp. MB-3u-54]PKH01098.1 hypothetical protein CXF72_18870 [Psychromonas sp. MB-3u-54]
MFEMIVMVNLRTKKAYASGNKNCSPDMNKNDLYDAVVRKGGSNNYENWSKEFKNINEFEYIFVSEQTEAKTKQASKNEISLKGWFEVSLRTVPKKL